MKISQIVIDIRRTTRIIKEVIKKNFKINELDRSMISDRTL